MLKDSSKASFFKVIWPTFWSFEAQDQQTAPPLMFLITKFAWPIEWWYVFFSLSAFPINKSISVFTFFWGFWESWVASA